MIQKIYREVTENKVIQKIYREVTENEVIQKIYREVTENQEFQKTRRQPQVAVTEQEQMIQAAVPSIVKVTAQTKRMEIMTRCSGALVRENHCSLVTHCKNTQTQTQEGATDQGKHQQKGKGVVV